MQISWRHLRFICYFRNYKAVNTLHASPVYKWKIMQVNGIKWILSWRGIIAVYGSCKRKGHVGSRIHGPSTRPVHVRVHGPWAGDTCAQTLHHVYGVHGKSTRQLHVRVRTVHGRVDGRCAAAYGPCTRPCNVSCALYTAAMHTAREDVFARENGPYTAV